MIRIHALSQKDYWRRACFQHSGHRSTRWRGLAGYSIPQSWQVATTTKVMPARAY